MVAVWGPAGAGEAALSAGRAGEGAARVGPVGCWGAGEAVGRDGAARLGAEFVAGKLMM